MIVGFVFVQVLHVSFELSSAQTSRVCCLKIHETVLK